MNSTDRTRSSLTSILAAGVIAHITENGRLKVLLLKRVGEDNWDWPKGLVEEKENQFNRQPSLAKELLIDHSPLYAQ